MLFNRKSKPDSQEPRSFLDTPLLQFSSKDQWTIRDACNGGVIFGGIGSGKTSGPGNNMATAFLEQGFGGIVLTAKPDELDLWKKYCDQVGRANDLMVFSPESGLKFNFMEYELNREGEGAGLTENLVSLFTTVMDVSNRKQGKTNEDYWANTLKQLLRNTVELVQMASGHITIADLQAVIASGPRSYEQVTSENWQAQSKCFRYIQLADQRAAEMNKVEDLEVTLNYWLEEFPGIAEKTRSIIISSFTSLADAFLRSPLRDLFCTETNITPEITFEGKIIVLQLPIKEYNELGQMAQVLFKYIWQRAVERRKVSESTLPVFLWADECHYFYHPHDQLFQTTARSSRACVVYLTQNLPNFYAALGGESQRSQVESLLGNLSLKLFLSNSCHKTNTYAADLISRDKQTKVNYNMGGQSKGQDKNNMSFSENLEYEVLPIEFTRLKTGASRNGFLVQAIGFQNGRIWEVNGRNFIRLSFNQKGL